jgi:hypothetical protein
MLVGPCQIAPLLTTYGQLARRSAILHHRRYHLSDQPKDDSPTEDEAAFREVLKKVEEDWPFEDVPQLQAAWKLVMRASLGSVGLMKMQLNQLASLQMKQKRDRVRKQDAKCAFKPPKTLNQIEAEMVEGEESLRGACYGEGGSGRSRQRGAVDTCAGEAPCMVSKAHPPFGERPRGLSFQLRRCTAFLLAGRGRVRWNRCSATSSN